MVNTGAAAFRTQFRKFSCKPPGHEAARLRENQRRHRARVKGRIAELEAALSNTQTRLNEALQRIDALTAEVHRLHTLNLDLPNSQQRKIVSSSTVVSGSCCSRRQGEVIATPQSNRAVKWNPAVQDIEPPTTKNVHDDGELAGNVENPNDDCPLLPAPGTGESTIPCREAYSIIKERSTPEFDLLAANEWLKPGFRRAIAPGMGCRVQTHILFAFVDHITPD
ncbi:hypothetical protein C7999DRAFT_44203 [Corynascus novoguineensis]|uniref:BZIP domain-containing protein n=1 Tax=Corynascus novoguineensis TaxID=1126955 RepID=A0AAN7CL54_9PEZI|nr:hypothetical protein C7999DRAFT_44203 [Corynascus novoguineensis]